jgi:hypothetical protein
MEMLNSFPNFFSFSSFLYTNVGKDLKNTKKGRKKSIMCCKYGTGIDGREKKESGMPRSLEEDFSK